MVWYGVMRISCSIDKEIKWMGVNLDALNQSFMSIAVNEIGAARLLQVLLVIE